MIGWLYPAALAGLLAVAGPIVVHLLRRQQADRLPFPSLRFVRPTRTAAVRLRLPSDIWLLALRIAIVAGAALALAQPIAVTAERQRLWNARVARAIVVDTSASMVPLTSAANEAAAAEAQGVFRSVRIETNDLSRGLERAAVEVDRLPPARREIVIVSDFQSGALTAAMLDRVPAAAGLRFVPVGEERAADEIEGESLLGPSGEAARVQWIGLTGRGTTLTLKPGDGSGSGTGFRLLAPSTETDAANRLMRSIARSGVRAPSTDRPTAIVFPGTAEHATTSAIDRPWMVRMLLRLREDAQLARAAREAEPAAVASVRAEQTPIVRDRRGMPLATASAKGGELVIDVASPPSAFVSAAIVSSVLAALGADRTWGEREIARIPSVQLARWSRPAGEVPSAAWRQSAPGDARWLWVAALALLILETVVRFRRRESVEREAHADAA